jgi:hypothetical protein
MSLTMRGKRVLLLFEPGRGGGAALERAEELVLTDRVALTVVCVAPQAPSGSRCGNSALEFNDVVIESVAGDLQRARAQLEELGITADYELLIENAPPLERFAAEGGYELVLLPARRRPLRAAGHPAAGRLSRLDGVDVQVVGSKPRRAPHAAAAS